MFYWALFSTFESHKYGYGYIYYTTKTKSFHIQLLLLLKYSQSNLMLGNVAASICLCLRCIIASDQISPPARGSGSDTTLLNRFD